MNNEETKVLNQSEETVLKGDTTAKTETATEETPVEKKKSGIGSKAAYAAGGFAAGLASGVAGSAFAANSSNEELGEVVAKTENQEDVLVATDEGVRVAQVDDDATFAEAFADARAQVGPGGAFEWRGNVYNTYYAEEWNNMSSEERAEFQSRIDHETITGNDTEPVSEQTIEQPTDATQHVMSSDTEMVDDAEVEGDVKVLGVEAVMTDEGDQMIVAGIEIDGEQAILVDVDCDGTMDRLLVDADYDGMLDADEIIDVSEANIEVGDLMQMHDNDMYLAANDGMPDYMNDADVSAMA